MAGRRFDATVVFVAFSGEEQGLYGSTAFVRELARLFPGARVEAMLNCDIVGGDATANDEAALHRFRLYSSGTPRELSTRPQAVEREGSTDDTSPARNLMRYVGLWARATCPR
jgi:Zn-dependent M28 family amino/carboxypeptidase